MFGFVVGTLLVNTLFVFDVFVTKYQRKWSLWGSTMTYLTENYTAMKVIPIWTLIWSWLVGLGVGNDLTNFQVTMSVIFWIYMAVLYYTSTHAYYKWNIPDLKK